MAVVVALMNVRLCSLTSRKGAELLPASAVGFVCVGNHYFVEWMHASRLFKTLFPRSSVV